MYEFYKHKAAQSNEVLLRLKENEKWVNFEIISKNGSKVKKCDRHKVKYS